VDNKKKTVFFILYIFSIITFFIFLEIILRVTNYGIITEPYIKVKDKEGYFTENSYYINKFHVGFINEAESESRDLFSSKKSENLLRAFVVGGSTAQGFPELSNYSFGKITEVALNNIDLKNKFEIHNISYSAMSSYFVRDTAKKLLKFKPDFLVIYSGHNEYYGTFGIQSGKSHLKKLIYLYLKDFKIFQLILNISGVEKANKIKKTNKSLMETLLRNKFEKNDELDSIVSENFIKNIEYVLKTYKRRNIPVIIINPASNLIDMPPFIGKDDELYKDIIRGYYEAVMDKNIKKIESYYNLYANDDKQNANIVFLNGVSSLILKYDSYIDYFVKAKDMDLAPFRARTNLQNNLRDFYKNNKTKYPNMNYIDLEGEIYDHIGINALSNLLFYDQLHLNFNGNIFLSYLIIAKIFNLYGIEENKYADVIRILDEIKGDRKLIKYTDLNELLLYRSLSSLYKNPPFKDMSIPYRNMVNISENNKIYNDKELLKKIFDNSSNMSYTIVIEYLIDNNMYKEALDYTDSLKFVYPGFYGVYYYIGQIYEKTGEMEKANSFYKEAYVLSGKNKIMTSVLKSKKLMK
jgi:hypothetical protein